MSRHGKRAGGADRGSKSGPSSRREVDRPDDDDAASEVAALARRHRRFGWWALLLFLLLGLALESLHGLKVGWYLEVSSTTRRHLWTLAHAHGTLLAVLNLILAGMLGLVPEWARNQRRLASACLLGAAILLPAGFFLGGLVTHDGDPGLGVALVPVGGILLLTAVFLAARA